LETRYTLISEFFSQLTSSHATNAEQITSWPSGFADLKNPLTFILSPLRKGRGELTAPVFTSKSLFLRSAGSARRAGEPCAAGKK